MSFFNDFLESFDISDLKSKVCVSWVIGVGLAIVGDVKLDDFSSECIAIVVNCKKIKFSGFDLKIKSMCKGEIVISGEISNINFGGL